ncbi:hypothetical protein BDP67DRAFT_586856 [Colletotrichum lupini]|nr:hypothetical protein BDP67DRAFT_586856 [Colletotrichum lupini]
MGVSRKGSVGAVQLARMNSYAQQGGLLEGQQRQVMQNWLVVVMGVKSATQVVAWFEEFETSGQNADGLRVDWTGEDHDYPGPEVPDLTEAVKAKKADGREAAEWRLWRTGDSRPGILHSLHCAGTGTGTGTGTALGTGNAVSSKQAIGVIDKYCQHFRIALAKNCASPLYKLAVASHIDKDLRLPGCLLDSALIVVKLVEDDCKGGA